MRTHGRTTPSLSGIVEPLSEGAASLCITKSRAPTLHALPTAALALFANICYSAAYLVDVPLLSASSRSSWLSRQWILLVAGMLFALLLENYWIADEIYPDVH